MSPAKAKAATQPEEPQPSVTKKNLYESEIERYRATLSLDPDVALKRYGFTLYHSLQNREKIQLLRELGFALNQPEDDYNEGVLAYESGDYKRAKELFEKAYKAKDTLTCALYNLALTFEKLENTGKAITLWEQFLEHPKASEQNKANVEKHIKELKK
jgi:tetratricopeptide (TPR) repeat protein